MADVLKSLARGAMPTSPTTVYTAPTTGKCSVLSISIENGIGSPVNVTVTLGGVNLFTTKAIKAGGHVEWSGPEVLEASETISVTASAAGITYLISGVETDG